MNRPTRKQRPRKEEGAPGKESARSNSITTHNVDAPGPGRKVALARLTIMSPQGGVSLQAVSRSAGHLPATAQKSNPRSVLQFFAVPAEARCDDPRILGAGLALDVVSVSASWATTIGPIAPAPAWLVRLLVPGGGR